MSQQNTVHDQQLVSRWWRHSFLAAKQLTRPQWVRINTGNRVSTRTRKQVRWTGPLYSRTKIYTAGMSRYQSTIGLVLPAPDLSSKPTGGRCCCRSLGRTLDRFITLTAYAHRVSNSQYNFVIIRPIISFYIASLERVGSPRPKQA